AVFFWGTSSSFTPYFQMQPIRILFPALALFLVTRYLLDNRTILYYPIHLVGAVALLWNFEIGLPLFFCWLFQLTFLELFAPNVKTAVWNILRHYATGAGCAFLAFSLYAIVIRCAYGSFPNFNLVLLTLKMTSLGAFALPVPLLHPWNFLPLLYLTGLLVGVRCVLRRTPSPQDSLILYCAMWGCATFGYYIGRSHNLNLIAINREFIFLLVLIADRFWQAAHTPVAPPVWRLPHQRLFLAILFYFLVMPFAEMPCALQTWAEVVKSRWTEPQDNQPAPVQDLEFIRKHTQPGERILIFSENNGAYYAETQ
ncbi:TPA: hypothetical protein DDW35_12185, partial [Candidatus Sumerlaeota bacterium]|nr:hypothetical protein [Candidatus Sumerlaeota bacterium]